MELEFGGEIWEWRGPAPYYFVSLPEQDGLDLRELIADLSYGWGCIKVRARLGATEWETSLMPKDGGYVLPLKDAVRRPAGLDEGDWVTVGVTPVAPAAGRPPTQVPPDRKRGSPRERPAPPRTPVSDEDLTVLPANEVSWAHLREVFGTRGAPAACWCQRYKMRPGESWASEGPDELAARLREQAAHGTPGTSTTSGLVAYLDGEPVGWCAIEPRSTYPRLLRSCRVPWVGRTEDKQDAGVWALTCFVTRAGYRHRGISHALARAAVDFAREQGARAIEGYPDLVEIDYVGTRSVFADAGFVEVNRPTKRRAVMRIDF